MRSFSILAMVSFTTVLSFAGQVLAAQRVTAAAVDLRGADLFQVDNGNGIPTSATYITVWGSNYQAPSWGAPAQIFPFNGNFYNYGYGFKLNTFTDYITVGNGGGLHDSTNRYAAALAYISYDDGALPGDAMTLTTVYGRDLAPTSGGPLSIAGYDAASLAPLLSGETITGPSGTVYHASAGQLMSLASLGGLLGPAADLSGFSGSTSDSVWVFQTQIPFLETAVPEPASLVAIAGLMVTGLTRRRA